MVHWISSCLLTSNEFEIKAFLTKTTDLKYIYQILERRHSFENEGYIYTPTRTHSEDRTMFLMSSKTHSVAKNCALS